MAEEKIESVKCSNCGGSRKHLVLKEHEVRWNNDDGVGAAHWQICECRGCGSIRVRHAEWDSNGPFDGEMGEPETTVRVYPEVLERIVGDRQSAFDFDAPLPGKVEAIYGETITALNNGARILAGAGLRAVVEAICMEAGTAGGNLEQRIDDLVKKNLLAKPQADLLHEERYLGNKAVHEIDAPTRQDILDGLQIVESLMNTMYVVPASAERLKKRRLEAAAKKAAAPAAKPAAPAVPAPAPAKVKKVP